MPALVIDLDITAGELIGYYRGGILTVRARAVTGQTVQFPASALRRHVASDGIHGRFKMQFDTNHKFLSLERVDN